MVSGRSTVSCPAPCEVPAMLMAEIERMRADLRAIRDHAALDHAERGLCEATRYLALARHALGETP